MNISDIVYEFKRLGDQVYAAYAPIVTQLCESEASESEISRYFDYMLEFAWNEDILVLYKKLCRHYLHIYPGCVGYYINSYRKMYDSDDE